VGKKSSRKVNRKVPNKIERLQGGGVLYTRKGQKKSSEFPQKKAQVPELHLLKNHNNNEESCREISEKTGGEGQRNEMPGFLCPNHALTKKKNRLKEEVTTVLRKKDLRGGKKETRVGQGKGLQNLGLQTNR